MARAVWQRSRKDGSDGAGGRVTEDGCAPPGRASLELGAAGLRSGGAGGHMQDARGGVGAGAIGEAFVAQEMGAI